MSVLWTSGETYTRSCGTDLKQMVQNLVFLNLEMTVLYTYTNKTTYHKSWKASSPRLYNKPMHFSIFFLP